MNRVEAPPSHPLWKGSPFVFVDLSCCFFTLGTLRGLLAPREELYAPGHVLVGSGTLEVGRATGDVKTVRKHLPLPTVTSAESSLGMAALDDLLLFACFYYSCMCSWAHV